MDAHPLLHHRRWAKQKISSFILIPSLNCVIFVFYRWDILSEISLHHFIGFIWIVTPLMKINVSIQETKIIAWRSLRALIPFAYRIVMGYAVLMRIKYATTPRNCCTRYPSRSSNGWAEFLAEPMQFLVDMLNHAYWLRITD